MKGTGHSRRWEEESFVDLATHHMFSSRSTKFKAVKYDLNPINSFERDMIHLVGKELNDTNQEMPMKFIEGSNNET
jgi:hypothetical protein